VVELLRRTVDERIAIRLEVADGLWPIRSDAAQIEAAIVNLALNARDAMPEGGELAIRLANTRLAQGELESGDYVELTVSDTGTGMPPDVLKRAFEPFFTTKGVGKGTGLGLSTTYGFIKESRGHIEIDSTPGAGTSVRILLPRAEGVEPAREEEPRRGSPDRAKGETILVVEDDAAVREVAVSALAQLGYRVLEAADAETGLDLLQRDDGICLLFTDLLMPGSMNGRELAQEALRRRPGLKVLYVSGYGGNAELLDEEIGLIRKPYRGEDLAGRVRAILDGAPVLAE
jgi:CheY-like chemotaxis protein